MRALSIIIVASLSVGCAEEPQPAIIGEAAYHFPPRDIKSVTREPHQFIRLSNAVDRFELVYDSRIQGRRDGQGLPAIFSITDGSLDDVRRFSTAAGEAVCGNLSNMGVTCGIPLTQAGASWSVLFPQQGLARAGDIRRRAEARLRSYEVELPSR